MYYFAGIFDLKKEKNTEKIFLNMFSGENKKNCYIFYDQFFYLGYKLPNNKYSCLDVPRFFRPSKIISGSIIRSVVSSCVKKKLNSTYVASYFFLDGLNIGDSTEYENVYNLMPGNLLVFGRNGKEVQDFSFFSEPKFLPDKTVKEYCYDFFKKIQEAIKKEIQKEKKCSIAFSGGVDTGLLLGLLDKEGVLVETKTVNFKTISRKNEDYNRAKKRAADYGINHKVVIFKPKQFLKILSEVVPKLDRLANINILNSLIIFRLISEGGDIIFSGDGAEEQLGFYNYHGFAYNFDRMVKNLPLSDTRDIYQNSLLVIYNSIFCRSWEWKNNVSPKAYFTDLFSNDFNKKINNANLYGYFLRCIDRTIDSSTTVNTPSQFPSLFNKILSLDFINNIVPNKFMLSDITSRLYSVKISLPFASENLVHFLFRIPAFLKTRNDNYANSKYIERLALSRFMNDDIAFSEFKSGSDIPFCEWLLDKDFEKMVKKVLSPRRVARIGVFKKDYIEKIIKEHYKNRKVIIRGSVCIKDGIDHMHKILKLVGFVLWWENNFDNK